MKPLILTICMFFTTISFLQGQVNKVKHENASNEQKTLLPSIPGDKPGETEELRRFLNKNLDMNLVANPKLKKGYVLIDCKLDASGNLTILWKGQEKIYMITGQKLLKNLCEF